MVQTIDKKRTFKKMKVTRINSTTENDIKQIVALHSKLLPDSLLSLGGSNLLIRLYTNLSNNKNCFLIIAREKNKIIGFGLLTTSIFISELVRPFDLTLIKATILILIKKPKLLYQLPYYIYSNSSRKSFPELQFLAVSKRHQGRGIGIQIIKLLNKELAKRKIKNYYLKTLADDKRANNFYLKLGFVLNGSDDFMGNKFNYYHSPKITVSI